MGNTAGGARGGDVEIQIVEVVLMGVVDTKVMCGRRSYRVGEILELIIPIPTSSSQSD
jgi:hypothetical protein